MSRDYPTRSKQMAVKLVAIQGKSIILVSVKHNAVKHTFTSASVIRVRALVL